jgi:phosphoribosyl 1,2-cyclic phosphodiesterase
MSSYFSGRLGRILIPNKKAPVSVTTYLAAAVSSLSAALYLFDQNNNKRSSSSTSITQCEQPIKEEEKDCPTNKNENQEKLASICSVSNLAIHGDPKTNKNYRNNPSFLIHHQSQNTTDNDNDNGNDNKEYKNIIIDVGKTFREGALRWFPEFGIQSLDAIVITHHHMDAAAGLDDVRGFQKPLERSMTPKRTPMPIYMSAFCYHCLQAQFPWLLPKQQQPQKEEEGGDDDDQQQQQQQQQLVELLQQDETQPIVRRDVASFDVTIFQDYQPMTVVGDLKITPLPVWHGEDLICHGFAFSVPSSSKTSSSSSNQKQQSPPVNVLYLSDISRMIPETLEFILNSLPPTDILIVDALRWHQPNPTHFSLDQAVALRDQIAPKQQTYLVGMSCDGFLPHEEMNAHLKAKYGNVQLAHDGLAINLE